MPQEKELLYVHKKVLSLVSLNENNEQDIISVLKKSDSIKTCG